MKVKVEKSKEWGFQRGLDKVYETCTADEYNRCFKECREVCMTTEEVCASKSSFYNKRRGKRSLSVAEAERLERVFAKYGVTDWRGC